MSSQLQSEAAFESGIPAFIYRQWFKYRQPVPAGTSLAGQTAIITGANVGLGLESSRQLLALGLSTLIVAVRSQHKGDEAAKGLKASHPNARIEVWLVDMESYDSVQNFAKRCDKDLDRIDIVILNAGLQSPVFQRVAATGHDQVLQVNYFSTALLAILLLPIMKAKRQRADSPPVLSVVSSDTAYWATLETDRPVTAQLNREDGYTGMNQYKGTKLLEMLFVAKLAEQVDANEVIVNLANPGFTAGTAFGRNSSGNSWASHVMSTVFRVVLARTIEAGASNYVDAAVVKGKGSHGSFCSDWDIRPYPPLMYTDDGQKIKERLWEETMEELNFAGVSSIIQSLRG
ncbi:hypothetical protein PFICI_14279 [Pestalotiopsis fici W106-1]|uniref:Uncharacterized protein n=1 Tax=Pestalotiopsis fici (strain W106-1 / CGMCC3.15140) TaxID=1229662 RepID=W3WKK5_PESFW|nr:uncharacterized protein PFICI_14279 [Pestalotiopsis fici W106-1]ETS74413.1 hypothetical protein PFICI_14279 [Pestalotiopsis fici W106-1]